MIVYEYKRLGKVVLSTHGTYLDALTEAVIDAEQSHCNPIRIYEHESNKTLWESKNCLSELLSLEQEKTRVESVEGRRAMKLTVIYRDERALNYTGDPPTHRSVQIELTPEQCQKLKPRHLGFCCDRDMYEQISMVFIEPEVKES